MALPPVKVSQDAFSSWYLQPTGCDPGDALGFFGSATPGERSSLIRRGFILVGEVQGDMGNPEEPLVIRPPTMDKCRWILATLRKRVPQQREKLTGLLEESVMASGDSGLPMSERQIYRERCVGFRSKLQELWRVMPLNASDRREMATRAKELESVAANKDLLDDERRGARDEARLLRQQIEDLKQLRVYTPAGLRHYFLLAYRVQMINRLPKPHFETQNLLAQIAATQEEEKELTVQAAIQQEELVEGEEEPASEPESESAPTGRGRKS
ncbi:hypothetical protein LCGC14_1331580 [marine sediment metagenome]|uniref:Uncharacterized protein n=1 Tax=marine sediment metagenome TaxID=412755 RepID=A0A0F9MXA3_9ZZZZ